MLKGRQEPKNYHQQFMDTNDTKPLVDAASGKMGKTIEHLESELLLIRAGKASVHIFDNVQVEYYGAPTPLSQVAGITVPDARTVLIQPWEKKLLPVIEKAILLANLGFTPQNSGDNIRINVPPLTEERRIDLVKQVRVQVENTRTALRSIRRDAVEAVKKLQKNGLAIDIAKDVESDIQKMTDEFVRQADGIAARKEKEIMTV
jgi:ribosome recycling factor